MAENRDLHEADTPIWPRGIGFHLEEREDLFGGRWLFWVVDGDNGKTFGGQDVMGVEAGGGIRSTRWLTVQYGRLRDIRDRFPGAVDPRLMHAVKSQIVAVYQEKEVVIDPDWLDNLPLGEFDYDVRPPRLDLSTGRYVPAEAWDEIQRQEAAVQDAEIDVVLRRLDTSVKSGRKRAASHR